MSRVVRAVAVSACLAASAFCADFDSAGETPLAFGFEEVPNALGGSGPVDFGVTGKSLPRAARVTNGRELSNRPPGGAGLSSPP